MFITGIGISPREIWDTFLGESMAAIGVTSTQDKWETGDMQESGLLSGIRYPNLRSA